jgi:hypothetical protein
MPYVLVKLWCTLLCYSSMPSHVPDDAGVLGARLQSPGQAAASCGGHLLGASTATLRTSGLEFYLIYFFLSYLFVTDSEKEQY